MSLRLVTGYPRVDPPTTPGVPGASWVTSTPKNGVQSLSWRTCNRGSTSSWRVTKTYMRPVTGVARTAAGPAIWSRQDVERVEAREREQYVDRLIGRLRTPLAAARAQPSHDLPQALAAPLLPGAKRLPELGIERAQCQQPLMDRPMRGPEAAECRDEPPQGFVGIRLAEGLGQVPHPAPPGEVVEQGLEQLRSRSEPLVHGGPGDAGPAGDGIDTEGDAVRRDEQRAGRPE